MDKIKIQNNSGDKDNFTIIPNYVLNHSSAIDQALYLQMKRYAGDYGECFASKTKLMKQLGIGKKNLNKSLEYLLNNKWITFKGYKEVPTKGGTQTIATYSINNIWQLNSQHYGGRAERDPLDVKGGAERNSKGGLKVHKGGSERATNNIHSNNIHKEKEVCADKSAPFTNKVLLEYINKSLEDKRKHIRIIGQYIATKTFGLANTGSPLEFGSKNEVAAFFRRNLKAASALNSYSENRIKEVMDLLQEYSKGFVWTLETVAKKISMGNTEIKKSLK